MEGLLRLTGKTKKRIPNSVFYKSRSTPSYSLIKDGGLCAPCCVFAKSNELFVTELHSEWSNVDRHIDRHVKCKTHLVAAEAADEFLKICEQKCSSVKQRLSQAYHDQVEGNRQALILIAKTIVLCGKQKHRCKGTHG